MQPADRDLPGCRAPVPAGSFPPLSRNRRRRRHRLAPHPRHSRIPPVLGLRAVVPVWRHPSPSRGNRERPPIPVANRSFGKGRPPSRSGLAAARNGAPVNTIRSAPTHRHQPRPARRPHSWSGANRLNPCARAQRHPAGSPRFAAVRHSPRSTAKTVRTGCGAHGPPLASPAEAERPGPQGPGEARAQDRGGSPSTSPQSRQIRQGREPPLLPWALVRFARMRLSGWRTRARPRNSRMAESMKESRGPPLQFRFHSRRHPGSRVFPPQTPSSREESPTIFRHWQGFIALFSPPLRDLRGTESALRRVSCPPSAHFESIGPPRAMRPTTEDAPWIPSLPCWPEE